MSNPKRHWQDYIGERTFAALFAAVIFLPFFLLAKVTEWGYALLIGVSLFILFAHLAYRLIKGEWFGPQ